MIQVTIELTDEEAALLVKRAVRRKGAFKPNKPLLWERTNEKGGGVLFAHSSVLFDRLAEPLL